MWAAVPFLHRWAAPATVMRRYREVIKRPLPVILSGWLFAPFRSHP